MKSFNNVFVIYSPPYVASYLNYSTSNLFSIYTACHLLDKSFTVTVSFQFYADNSIPFFKFSETRCLWTSTMWPKQKLKLSVATKLLIIQHFEIAEISSSCHLSVITHAFVISRLDCCDSHPSPAAQSIQIPVRTKCCWQTACED